MKSVLTQLAKYQPQDTPKQTKTIELKETAHPYQEMVEKLCDTIDPFQRKQIIKNALVGLNDFVPPPTTNQLYPIELAVLYHLFYRHKICLCGESKADTLYGLFLKSVVEKDGGLDVYMRTLKNRLDKVSTSIFLYRIMLAAFSTRETKHTKRDYIQKEYGLMAAKVLGIEATVQMAGHGLDSLAGSNVEQLILGRIAYVAFWEWSRVQTANECGGYLAMPSANIQAPIPNPQKPVALPPHQP